MFLESAANSAAFSGVGVGGAGAGTGTGTGAGGDCIQTYVRIRPQEGSPSSAVSVDPSRGLVSTASSSFVFDHVGGTETTQEEVFNAVGQSLCDHALEGFNVTLFCYGQTGTGKTYTMQGPSSYSSSSDQHHNDYKDRGLVQRTIEYLLACQDTNSSNTTTGDHQHETNHRIEYLNKISSFVEIYNESIFDLLDPEAPQCQLREDLKKGGIYVHGATERVIETTQDAQQILEIGNRNRTTASTEMNRCSSRSHSILTLTIQTKTTRNGITHVKESRVNLVDLAGSERQKSASTVGQRLREGGHINKSLLTLGSCINALVDIANGKTRHVHYRDSKLTLMLKDSLGGNSKATMVATISPLSSSLPETMSTLRFASRAKLIKNRAQINQLVESANLQLMQEEIKRLKIELERYEQGRQYFNNHNTSNDDGGIDEGGGHTTITSSSTSLLPLPTSSSSATRIAFDTELLKILQQKCAAMETRLEKANHFVTNFQEISRRKDQQIQHDKMLLRLKDSQIERLRVSSSGGSKQSEDEAVVVDEEKELLKREISILKASSDHHQSPDAIQYATRVLQLQDELEKLQNAQQIVAQAEERQRAFENLETSWAERVVAFEEEKDILMKQIEELKTSEWHVSIVQELDAVKLEIETVKAGKRELESTVAMMKKDEINYMADMEKSHKHVDDLTKYCQKQTKEVQALHFEINNLKLKLAESDAAQDNESTTETLEALLKKTQDELETLRYKLHETETDRQEMERSERRARRISDYSTGKEAAMKELVDQLRSERVELDASIKQFTEKSLGDDAAMAKLKTELSECRRQIHDLEEREKKKQDEIEVLVSEQQLLQNDCQSLEDTVSALQSQLEEVNKQMLIAKEDKTYLERSLNNLNQQDFAKAKTLELELKAVRHELEEEVKRRDVLVSSHSSRIAELVEKISVCKKRIVELENQVEGMAEVVEENENMRDILVKLEQGSTDLSSKLEHSLAQLVRVSREKESLTDKLNEKESELRDLMVKYESARLDYLETQKEESSANTTAAASRVSQLESELRKTRMEMALIEEDLAESERVVKQYEEKEFEGSKSFPEAVKTYSNKTTTVTLRDFTADSHTQTLKEYIKFERIAEVLDETTTVLEEVKRVNQVQKQELDRVKAENERFMQHSNQKQKLQYMVQLKRENNDLKMEVRDMRMRLDEIDKNGNSVNHNTSSSSSSTMESRRVLRSQAASASISTTEDMDQF